MKIAIGADHAGYQLKEKIKEHLQAQKMEFRDLGTFKLDSCDYPEYAYKVSMAVLYEGYNRGILICGTGIGMCITANKVKGVRAAMAHNPEFAKLSRLHNDSNILCLAGRHLEPEQAFEIIDVWLNTSFEGGRHQNRIDLINNLTGK